MIRPAKMVDIPRMVALLEDMQKKSKYVDHDEVDPKIAHQLLAQCVMRHGHIHDGGSLAMVAIADARIEGLMIGILDRTYHVGKKLCANDIFLYCTDKAHKVDMIHLFDAYLSWATHNPKVVEIRASWTDTLEGAERITSLYERRGFRKCGEIFERLQVEPQRSSSKTLEEMVK